MSLLLGFFFSLEARELQGLEARGVQPNMYLGIFLRFTSHLYFCLFVSANKLMCYVFIFIEILMFFLE